MSLATYATFSPRSTGLKFQLLLGGLFPLFLLAAGAQRVLGAGARDGSRSASLRSVMGEARENMLIVISYALVARAMLQSFAREDRAERLS